MIKIEITIPQYYNNKKPIEQIIFDKIKRELLRQFKGLTISNSVEGYWIEQIDKDTDFNNIDKVGIEYQDTNKIYTVITENTQDNNSWINGYKKWLEYILDQKEIFIIKSEVSIIN